MILNGTICLDMAASTLDDICELALDNMINANVLTFDKKAFVKDAILKKHRHQYEGQKDKKEGSNMSKLPLIRSLAEIGRNHSSSKSKNILLPNYEPCHPRKCSFSMYCYLSQLSFVHYKSPLGMQMLKNLLETRVLSRS